MLTLVVFCCSQSFLRHLSFSAPAVAEESHAEDSTDHARSTPGTRRTLTRALAMIATRTLQRSRGAPLQRRLAGGGGDAGPVVVALELQLAIFICRCFSYICSMGILIHHHSRRMGRIIRAKDFITVGRFKVPAYVASWQEVVKRGSRRTVCDG